ncbi:MAG: hypothetical protein J6B31_01230 [Bacteroidaceae bacterium]|nr:hypothetical protein [Bacteroidaceae bacterium]
MKKKIIISITAAIVMSCLLGIISYLVDTWECHKVVRWIILVGWVYITYNMITLKYNWIRKLAE